MADASPGSVLHAGLIGGLRNVAIFFVALAVVSTAIRATRPFPDVSGVFRKYAHFADRRADYDALFVGSSRFHHSIIPRRFDARVTALTGVPIHSFNFGQDAMWPPESYYMMRKLLALHPPRLRWVFIDCTAIHTAIEERLTFTKRFAYWHDARHTALVWRAIAEEPLPWSDRLRRWTGHAAPLLRNWTNTGAGAEWLAFRLGSVKRKKSAREMSPKAWAATEGYEAEPDVALTGDALDVFLGRVADFRADLPAQPIGPVFRRALEEIIAEVRAAGARPVLVLTPTVKHKENFTALPDGVPVLRFQDPNQFPQLFDSAHCYDLEHLNDAGAQIFTDLLAADFAELAREHP